MASHTSAYTSEPFKFVVDGKSFYVHKELITPLSKPLDCLINLDMKEKSQGYASLEGVDASTFESFLEWVYKGYYTPPEPSEHGATTKETSSPSPANPGTPASTIQNDHLASTLPLRDFPATSPAGYLQSPSVILEPGASTPTTGASSTTPLTLEIWDDFTVRSYNELRTPVPLPSPRRNHKRESYAKIFLCHARLYVFAEERDIQKLRRLALENLHAVLLVFEPHKKRVHDVVTLLKYVYEHTAVSTDEQPEPLRSLLVQYMAFKLDELSDSKHFKALMIDDGGPMLDDYMRAVKKRVAPPAKKTKKIREIRSPRVDPL